MSKHNPSQQLPAKIGLFGGTFDPIHRGHQHAAEDILQQFKLDRIHFIPCAIQPHKTSGPIASAAHRLEMLKLALANQAEFVISEVEIERQGPSYTIATLRYFKETQEPGNVLHFIIGVDAFLEIDAWKSFAELFDLATFIVMARPGVGGSADAALGKAADFTRHHISAEYRLNDQKNRLVHPVKHPIYLATVRQIDIASRRIRHMILRGESEVEWVMPEVANYIAKKGLYR